MPHTPPKSYAVDEVDVFNHLNKEMEKTPFISTASDLLWFVQQVIKCIKAGDRDSQVATINPSKLDPRTIFYANPFHKEIKQTYAFTNGAWRYPGVYEYLVWKEVR